MDTSFSSNGKYTNSKRRRRFRERFKKDKENDDENEEEAKLVSSKKKKKRRILLQIDHTKSAPEEAATFEVINTTLNKMETIIADHKKKYGDDCDEDKDLTEKLSMAIKELYLSTHFSSTKSKQIFYLAFYKLHGIPRLLSILKMITCTRNDLALYDDDGFKELDINKVHECLFPDTSTRLTLTRKIMRVRGHVYPFSSPFLDKSLEQTLSQTRKRPISKAYIFLFLFKIMNWEDLCTTSHNYIRGYHDIIKNVCIKMQQEFIVCGGIQLLIDTNKANIHYDRMTDMKIIWNILSMILFQLNVIIDENVKHYMFDSVLDTLTLLCKFPDDQYVISTFNSILNFLNRSIPLLYSSSSSTHMIEHYKQRLVPILSKANTNPNGSYRENINADLVNKFMVTYNKYFPNEKNNTNES
jgi:hypothetical protein